MCGCLMLRAVVGVVKETCVDAARRVLSPIFLCPSSGRHTRVRETVLRGGQRKIGATRSRLAGAVNASALRD